MAKRLRFLKEAWPLLPLPLVFLALQLLLSHARGPFYLAYSYDPDYAYLFNGLNLAGGIAPEHVDHPGVPLQLFAAGGIKLANLGSSRQSAIAAVLARSESYLNAMNSALMICYFIALLLLGILVWRSSGSLLPALLLQATPFLLAQDFREVVRFRPESLLLIIALAMAAVLYVRVLRDEPDSIRVVCLLSFLAATGVACKINFLPLVLLPLFALRTWRDRAGFLVLLSFFGILWLLPLRPHQAKLAAWVFGLVTREGPYGIGEPGVLGPNYPMFALQLLLARPIFSLTLGLSLAAVIYAWGARHGKKDSRETRLTRLLAGLVLAHAGAFLMAAKFQQGRYLVPAVAFCGLNGALLLTLARRWLAGTAHLPRVQWIAVTVFILIAGWVGFTLRHLHVQMAESRDIHSEMAGVLEKNFERDTIIYSYGCSSRYYALWFGNTYAGRRYGQTIIGLFPNHSPAYVVEVLPEKTYWYSVAGPDVPIEDRLERGEVLILAAQQWSKSVLSDFPFLPKNVSLTEARRKGGEAIYRIQPGP